MSSWEKLFGFIHVWFENNWISTNDSTLNFFFKFWRIKWTKKWSFDASMCLSLVRAKLFSVVLKTQNCCLHTGACYLKFWFFFVSGRLHQTSSTVRVKSQIWFSWQLSGEFTSKSFGGNQRSNPPWNKKRTKGKQNDQKISPFVVDSPSVIALSR